MSPPIRDGSGSSIGSIRLGDGSEIAEVRTGAGDVLFSSGPDVLKIDDFEDNDIAEYGTKGGAGFSATTQTNTVKKGNVAVQLSVDGQNGGIASTSGLGTYPDPGAVTRCWIRASGDVNRAGWMLGCDGGTTNNEVNGYAASLDPQKNEFVIEERGTNIATLAADSAVTLSNGTWFNIEFVYNSDDSLEAEVFDENGNSISNRLTATDSTYSGETGVGFHINAGSTVGDVFGDFARISNLL